MSRWSGAVRDCARKSWNTLLELDNYILGLGVATAAVYDWMILYDSLDASFAVINFSLMILVGALIGGRERVQTEQFEKSVEYEEQKINKE